MLQTVIEFCKNVLFLGGTMAIGATIASFLVSQTLYSKEELSKKVPFQIDADSEEEGEEEDEEQEISKFMNLYSLENIERVELMPDEIEGLKHKSCVVDTPSAKVLMTYDDPYFMYYAQNGSILPYRFLDVVARKFVLDNNCVSLYKKLEIVELDEEIVLEQNNEAASVFVVKKRPVKKQEIITKTMNKFKYGGQIADYASESKESKIEPKKLTFSDYKKMINTNSDNNNE